MDRGRRLNKITANKNSKIYMDLEDIIREHTLPFLPAKSLYRFKGVCRDWKLQISTPFLAHNQSNSFHNCSGFFCQSFSNPPSFISLDENSYGVPDPSLLFLPEPVYIRSSCNGLLCCQGRTHDKAYYICNPVTKQWKKLPKPNADHGSNPALVLIFEPSILNFVAGYKLICAFSSADFESACEFEIYNSTEGSWRIFGEIYFGAEELKPKSGVHVNGIIYWLFDSGGIVLFDLTMQRSQRLHHGHINGCLGVMNGKLSLVTVCNETLTVSVLSNTYTNTMAMNSKVKAWDTKLSVNIKNRLELSGFGPAYDRRSVLYASGDLIVIRGVRGLYSFNTKTQEFGGLRGKADHDDRYIVFIGYVNSLVDI
ncbi:F-box protein At5g07610-like [Juglans microcarpa x Juglans regia]|uniref:F-box protein At5g07610-like n=1 Tax=Juglans microcarpa x Juglans regia TaxID=2249226 RepID=UPI001B7E9DA2|nr:F-box protein At5g07610-like [Juglans microcarpa x Juglans regia]